jgi:hypothetical protein
MSAVVMKAGLLSTEHTHWERVKEMRGHGARKGGRQKSKGQKSKIGNMGYEALPIQSLFSRLHLYPYAVGDFGFPIFGDVHVEA